MTMHVSKVKVFSIIAFIGALAFTSIFTSNLLTTYATTGPTSNTNEVNAHILGTIAIRLLDSTATSEISQLDFSFDGSSASKPLPTPSGVSQTNTTVVDVATTNPTGYKLYMQSNYQDTNNNYTTNLTNTDTDVSDNIPTAVPTSGSPKVYWNYTNPLTSTNTAIPTHGSPDKIAQSFSAGNSSQTNVDINVGVDTSIVSGAYENELEFSAVSNPDPVTYAVNFNSDGGSATPAISEDVAASVDNIVLSSTAPTKTGYTFSHWQIGDITSTHTNPMSGVTTTSTNAVEAYCLDQTTNAHKNTCSAGDTFRIYSNGEETVSIDFTAVYTINTHTVTINTGTGISSTTGSNTYNYGDTVTIGATASTGYTFSGWTVNSGGVTINNNQFTMPDSDVVITANTTKNTGTVTITRSNTYVSANTYSLTIPYGESRTFTITPTSGYYISQANCPGGSNYSCSGNNTGISYTSAETVTVTNNNPNANSSYTITIGGTLAQATSCAEAQPVEPGSTPGAMNMYTSNNIQYVKLYTNSSKTSSACYTKSSQGTSSWYMDKSSEICTGKGSVPSSSQFQSLLNAYGTGGNLYLATGWDGSYWSSTSGRYSNCTGIYCGYTYRLGVSSSYATVDRNVYPEYVICISS